MGLTRDSLTAQILVALKRDLPSLKVNDASVPEHQLISHRVRSPVLERQPIAHCGVRPVTFPLGLQLFQLWPSG
jgi:hypothetical protein